MTFKGIKLPRGECANGRAESGGITVYVSSRGIVYRLMITDCGGSAGYAAEKIAYCDEMCPLPYGGRLERRGNVLKVNY